MKKVARRQLLWVGLLAFLFSAHSALGAYVNSSFIDQLIGSKWVGIVYAAASLLSVISLALLPYLLKKYSLKTLQVIPIFLVFSLLAAITIIPLSYPLLLVAVFGIYLGSTSLVIIVFDLLVEHYSSDAFTGEIRGAYLTTINVAFMVSPFLAGILVDSFGIRAVYGVGMVLVFIILLIASKTIKPIRIKQKVVSPLAALEKVYRDKFLAPITLINFFLMLFYAWMVVYLPIYLTQTIGFSWGQVGLMFTAMLSAFVLFQFPLGWLADKKYGEKEILTIGIILMAAASFAVAFTQSTQFWVWLGILFGSRVGASSVEIMAESYFFKHISTRNAETISVFRLMYPLAYIIGMLGASVILAFGTTTIPHLFAVLGSILIIGIPVGMSLRDTK